MGRETRKFVLITIPPRTLRALREDLLFCVFAREKAGKFKKAGSFDTGPALEACRKYSDLGGEL